MRRRLRTLVVLLTAVTVVLTVSVPVASARRSWSTTRPHRRGHVVTTTVATSPSSTASTSTTTTTRPPQSTPTSGSTTTTTTSPPVLPAPAGTNAKPAAGGYFSILPPGSSFPSEAECAARVRASTWEPRPENTVANHTVPPQPYTLGKFSSWNSAWNSTYKPRISGIFTGTTYEIIQWVACKWGWSFEVVRAQAVQESTWRESAEGDKEARSRGHCTYDDTRDPCPVSFGIVQEKWYYNPDGVASNAAGSSYPWIKRSTAFSLDVLVGQMRGCYDGMSTYLGNTRGNLWGCIGSWYSGSWDPSGGSYATSVQNHLAAKPWLSWAG
jgi:hypothetical protein